MPKFLLPIACFFVLVVFLAIGLTLDPKLVPSPLINKAGPAFNLPTLRDANQQFSNQQMQGKVSLFNVWASWCVACREEHPFLMELTENNVVPVYGLNYKDEKQDAIAWLARFGNPYQLIAFDLEGRVGLDWGVYGVPETFIVDRKGLIRYKHVGPLDHEVWNNIIFPIIKQLRSEQG